MQDDFSLNSKPPWGFSSRDITPPMLLEKAWRVTSLALDVSGSCNLACRYCAEASTQPQRPPMSREILERALAYLLPERDSRADVSIRLGSGEPLLALPLLHQLDELIRRNNQNLAKQRPLVFLTTNGTLIDQETANWLTATGWQIKISLDGPQEIQDSWRVTPDGQGTYAKVAKAAAYLAKKIPGRVSVTAVLCRSADPGQVFESIARLGIRRIELVPVVHHNPVIQPDAADIKRYEAFTKDYVKRYLAAKDNDNLPVLVRLENYITRVMGYNNLRISCGAGRSFLGVSPDGGLYPCFRFIGLEDYRLGDLTAGMIAQAVRDFRSGAGRSYEKRVPCGKCWAAPLCNGPCFACSEMFGPGKGYPVPYQCAYYLADARAAVRLVSQLRKQNPGRLLRFLPGGVQFTKSLGLSW